MPLEGVNIPGFKLDRSYTDNLELAYRTVGSLGLFFDSSAFCASSDTLLPSDAPNIAVTRPPKKPTNPVTNELEDGINHVLLSESN